MPSATKPDRYTAKRVLAITGVPYQTLNHWAKTGVIGPSITQAAGSGTERIYSFRDLVAIRAAVALRRGGINTKCLIRVMQFVQQYAECENALSETRLVVIGNDVLLAQSNEDLISTLRKPGQSYLAFVVDIPKVVFDVSEAAGIESAA